MNITVTARHFEVTEAIKEYAQEKIERVAKLDTKLEEAHIILSIEKIRQGCEVILTGKHLKLSAQDETQDIYASIDSVENKLIRQIKKNREKHKNHRMKINDKV